MRLTFTTLLLCAIAFPAMAQTSFEETLKSTIDGTGETTPAQPAEAAPIAAEQPKPETAAPAPTAQIEASLTQQNFEKQKYAILQTLDKVTARTATITLPIDTPTAVGPLFVEVKTCQKTPVTEQPEAAGFLQIWEPAAKDKKKSQWVFSGWMFASSPALSAMNHPTYDVWVKDCTNEIAVSKEK